MKNQEVKIKLGILRNIANYYEFPLAVFFVDKLPKGTRKDNLLKQIKGLKKKLISVIEEILWKRKK